MKTLKLHFIALIVLLPMLGFSQGDCAAFFDLRKPEPPFEYNDQSKGAVCVSGNSYEFNLTLTKGKDYRIKFFAAPVFNNRLKFKIIDESTHETILDLPGASYSGDPGTSVLQAYYNEDNGKMVHPFFDFYPVTSTNLKIIIDVLPAQGEVKTDDPSHKAPQKLLRGCVTVVILDKQSVNSSF